MQVAFFTYSARIQRKTCAQMPYNTNSRFLEIDTFTKSAFFNRYLR